MLLPLGALILVSVAVMALQVVISQPVDLLPQLLQAPPMVYEFLTVGGV